MTNTWAVDPADAVAPLMLALDIGSTASRGALFDAHGRPVGTRAKITHEFASGPGASQRSMPIRSSARSPRSSPP